MPEGDFRQRVPSCPRGPTPACTWYRAGHGRAQNSRGW